MTPAYCVKKVISVGTTGFDETELEISTYARNNKIIFEETLITSGMLGTTTEVAGIVKVSTKGPLPTRYDTYWPFTSLTVTK